MRRTGQTATGLRRSAVLVHQSRRGPDLDQSRTICDRQACSWIRPNARIRILLGPELQRCRPSITGLCGRDRLPLCVGPNQSLAVEAKAISLVELDRRGSPIDRSRTGAARHHRYALQAPTHPERAVDATLRVLKAELRRHPGDPGRQRDRQARGCLTQRGDGDTRRGGRSRQQRQGERKPRHDCKSGRSLQTPRRQPH
jgi:hypothetical protein